MTTDNITAPGKRNASKAVQAKKPQAEAYTPTSRAERQEAAGRYHANVEAILPLMEAGGAALPLAGKVPLAPFYQVLDTRMTVERHAENLDDWREWKGFGEDVFPTHGIGSTRTPERVKAMPRVNDELCFGISLGPTGALVVDCDDEGGAAFLAFLEANGETLDFTITPATMSPGRKGLHLYYDNREEKSGRKLKGLSVDVKAWGGQVVAPGQTLPPKYDEDGTLIPARTYVPVPGSLDLATAIRERRFPPVPACLIAYMLANPPSRGSASDEDAIRDAMDALSAGPAGDKPERDVAGMVDVLRGESPAFDKLWTHGHAKGDRSAFRIALANRLLARYGSAGCDPHDLAQVYALAGEDIAGEPRDRDVAREYGKAVRKGNVGASDGEAFGEVAGVVEVPADAAALDAAMADILGMDAGELQKRDGRQQLDALVAKHNVPKVDAPVVEDDGPLPAKIQAEKDRRQAERERQANRRPIYDEDVTLAGLAPVVYLVDRMVTLGEVIVTAGAPGAGKSADLLHLGRCVAAGRLYHGHETERAGVLYCSSENPAEDARRQVAHRQRYQDGKGLPFAVERGALSLYAEDGQATADEAYIIVSAKRMQAERGIACRLIILDNARRVIAPGDTSKEPDVVRLMQALERIRNATGAAIILIAHTVRAGDRFAGSGALESSADSLWHYEAAILPGTMRKDRNGNPKPVKPAPACITFPKMRTGDRSRRVEYALPVEIIGEDSKGRPLAVVVSADLPKGSTAGGASDGEAFGAADDETDGTASPGALPDAAEPQTDDEDARTVAILAAMADLGTGGATFQATAVLDAANAKLTARDRKAPRMSLRALQITLAELKEAGRVVRTGTGKLTAYSLPEAALE